MMKTIFLALFFSATALFAKPWGYHLILDCSGCEGVTDRAHLEEFVKTLVEEIDMKAYGEPILEHFAEHDPEAAGYSLVQLIETSAITGHFVDCNGDTYLDIFSCKSYDKDKAIEVVMRYLKPKRLAITFLERQAP